MRLPCILLTGATGFIGKQLAPYLQQHGFRVRALVRSSKDVAIVSAHVSECVQGDITDPQTLALACDKVDYVCHLAGYAHAWKEYQTHFDEKHFNINYQGTLNLLNFAKQAGVKRFLFFSSIKATRDPSNDQPQPIDETWDAWPTTAYGIAKRQAEEAVLAANDGQFLAIVLRLSLVYGIGWKGNLRNMLLAIDKGIFLPPPSLTYKKSMISVSDLCALVAHIYTINSHAFKQKKYIVTDGEAYTIGRIYQSMRQALGKRKITWHAPLWCWHCLANLGNLFQFFFRTRLPINKEAVRKLFGSAWYSTRLLETELGFVPKFTLEKILPDIVAYQKKKIE